MNSRHNLLLQIAIIRALPRSALSPSQVRLMRREIWAFYNFQKNSSPETSGRASISHIKYNIIMQIVPIHP